MVFEYEQVRQASDEISLTFTVLLSISPCWVNQVGGTSQFGKKYLPQYSTCLVQWYHELRNCSVVREQKARVVGMVTC